MFITDETGYIIYEINEDGYYFTENYAKDAYVSASSLGIGTLSPEMLKKKLVKSHFVKLNEVVYADLNVDLGKLSKLLPYVGYLDGILHYKNKKPIRGATGVAKIIGTSRVTAGKFVNELIEEDVIHKHTDKGIYYTFNPFIVVRGQKVLEVLYEEFKDSKWRYVNSGEMNKAYIEKQED